MGPFIRSVIRLLGLHWFCLIISFSYAVYNFIDVILADPTNGRAYATDYSVASVCRRRLYGMYCG